MKRSAIKRWVGACLLGSALGTGCSHYRSAADYPPSRIARPVALPPMDRPFLAQRKLDESQVAAAPKIQESQAEAPKSAPLPETLPAVAADDKDTSRSLTQTAFESSRPSAIGEPNPVRKSFVDITAQPGFNHSDDYSSLNGQLQHSRKGWRLRYASVDEADAYGGSVTLTDESRLDGYHDGDFVRAHGRVADPEQKGIAPAYLVDSIHATDKRD